MPIDILHLARTTKEFRKFLLHRSATGLWKDVLSNIEDVPSCPPGMSLPAWVNLLFETHCHVRTLISSQVRLRSRVWCPELSYTEREQMHRFSPAR